MVPPEPGIWHLFSGTLNHTLPCPWVAPVCLLTRAIQPGHPVKRQTLLWGKFNVENPVTQCSGQRAEAEATEERSGGGLGPGITSM